MAISLNPDLLGELKQLGAPDVSACFHCGNCTAVCPLTETGLGFPRRLIRLGQLGAKEALLRSPEPWLCYGCAECSETCPREAGPGEYMAAVRRYAVGQAEPTGLARWMSRSAAGLGLVSCLLALVLAAFLVGVRDAAGESAWKFSWVPYQTVHVLGQVVFALAGISLLVGVVFTLRHFLNGLTWPGGKRAWQALRKTLSEVVTMQRHRSENAGHGPWYRNPATIHLTIMYGFLGLFLATTLDYLFLVALPTGWTIFWPARILGTVAGVVMLAGVGLAFVRRIAARDPATAHSTSADWWLLAILLVLAVTGFWLEVVVTVGATGPFQDLVLLLHAALAMELVLLVGFTKLAHVVYRPLALFADHLRRDTEEL